MRCFRLYFGIGIINIPGVRTMPCDFKAGFKCVPGIGIPRKICFQGKIRNGGSPVVFQFLGNIKKVIVPADVSRSIRKQATAVNMVPPQGSCCIVPPDPKSIGVHFIVSFKNIVAPECGKEQPVVFIQPYVELGIEIVKVEFVRTIGIC